jgi:hypothetical protein
VPANLDTLFLIWFIELHIPDLFGWFSAVEVTATNLGPKEGGRDGQVKTTTYFQA